MGADSPSGPDEEPDAVGLTLRGVRMVRVSADEVVLRRGLSEVRLSLPGLGEILDRVNELADGTLDEQTLVAEFDTELQPQVRRLVSGIRSRGLLHPAALADPADAFWLSMTPFSADGASRLAVSSAVVIGAGRVADAVADALRACGVGDIGRSGEAPGAPRADVWCAASEAPVEAGAELVGIAEAALRADTVFLPVWIEDLVVRVGPMTHPFDTACLNCLLLRLDANDPERDLHRMMRAEAGDAHSGAGFLPPMATVAGQVAAMELVKHLAGLPVTSVGHAIELRLVPFRCDVRRVLRVPRCPLCSGVADRGAPVVAHASQLAE
jgi:bacteriocin biosynthesis cyclodehydratase domain-containing protein